jgi:hypothetical protein
MFLKYGSNVPFGGFGTEVSHKNVVHLLSPLALESRVAPGRLVQLVAPGLACSSHSTG